MKQKYTSKNTSVNSTKLPKLYGLVQKEIEGKEVLDYGCGKYFDSYKEKVKAKLTGYDKYHRRDRKALQRKYDVVLCSNVLNVIAESEVRHEVLKELKKVSDVAYITVYEGDRTGKGKVSKEDCYQLNRKTAEYIPELREVFSEVTRKGKVIVCKG